MTSKTSRWGATFVSQEIVEWTALYRRIYFKNLRNEKGLIVRDKFFIDESAEVQITGRLNYGDVIYFIADENLLNIKFCYPYGEENGK